MPHVARLQLGGSDHTLGSVLAGRWGVTGFFQVFEPPAGVQTMVGIYNVVWAGTGALAYFSGGAMLEKLSMKSLFYVPITVQLIQLGLTVWIERQARAGDERPRHEPASQDARSAYIAVNTLELNPRPIAKARTFLAMAWLANPFAYIASNTLIAVMPGVARRLGLSTMVAGFCCSIWCFARLGAFFGSVVQRR